MNENGRCSEGTEGGWKVKIKLIVGRWTIVEQEDGCREPLLGGPCDETDGEVVDIGKGVKGDDINRLTSGTAIGVAVGRQGRDVVGGTSDGTGECWEGSGWGGRL